MVDRRFVHFSADHTARSQQLRARQIWEAQPGGRSFGAGLRVVPDELKAAIVLFLSLLDERQRRTGLSIAVCHFPPGTSKWNKIEHRLFSHIATNWRGQPLTSLAVIVSLIGSTTRATGLRVRSEIDHGSHPKGTIVTDEQLARLNIKPHIFHGDWNYTIRPSKHKDNRSTIA